MNKIIQIVNSPDRLYCLTEDGKVYMRSRKDMQEHEEKQESGETKSWVTGTHYWKEVPEEENFSW